ncbi:MAG: hypothetical protein FJ033_10875 [Chloroflexi bacterium]|nr:hypothetical protein [Chloroflexota bacterium]
MSTFSEQVEYQDLLLSARRAGVPTSLDDPESPRTVGELRAAVAAAELSDAARVIGVDPDGLTLSEIRAAVADKVSALPEWVPTDWQAEFVSHWDAQ